MYQNFSLIKQNLSKVDPKSDHKFKKAVGLSLCKYCFDIINESLKTVSGGRADINNWNPEIFNGNIDDTTLNTEDSVKRNFMDVHHIFNENVSSNLGRKPGELLSKLKIFKNISGVYKTNMEQSLMLLF